MQKNLQNLTKNKPFLVAVGIIVLLLLGFGAYKLAGYHATEEQTETPQTSIDAVQNLSPEQVGLEIQPHTGSKCSTTPSPYNEVRFLLNKTEGIKHVAWQILYDADVPQTEDIGDNANSQVTQEIEQEADVHSGSAFASHYDFLGTCSHNVCRCDTGVKKVHYVLNITKTDGKHYKVEADKNFTSNSSE